MYVNFFFLFFGERLYQFLFNCQCEWDSRDNYWFHGTGIRASLIVNVTVYAWLLGMVLNLEIDLRIV